MTVLRLLWLDIQKLTSLRIMTFFIILPALLAFNGWFVSIAYLVYMYLVPYGIFSHDDQTLAENLYGALPVRREQIVAARYLLAVLLMALMVGLMLLVNTAFCLLFSKPPLAEDFVVSLTVGFVVGLVFIGAAFPLALHQGLRKANNNVLMIFVLVFIVLAFYGDNLRNISELPQVHLWSEGIFCLLVLAVSYRVAVKLFAKREFFDYVPLAPVQRAKGRG